MADTILDFLLYGAHPSSIQSVSPLIASHFLPSLALLASDSPSLIPPLLSPLASNPLTPQALAYAALDYRDISQSVLEAEAAALANSPVRMEEEKEEEGEGSELAGLEEWRNRDESLEQDECIAFEMADEKERVQLAIISLRRHATEFLARVKAGQNSDEVWIQQRKDEGSMWGNDACMPELLLLLPIAVMRCPTLLTPEHVVQGLLTARRGFVLLVATLINNPLLVKQGLHLLSEFVCSHMENSDVQLNASVDSSASVLASQSPLCLPAKAHLNQQSDDSMLHPQVQANVVVSHCVEQVLLTFIRLCKVSSSMAFMCREALVSSCAFAELALHITVELLHDELDFLSRVLFSAQKSSQWMLTFVGDTQKNLVCSLPPLTEAADLLHQSVGAQGYARDSHSNTLLSSQAGFKDAGSSTRGNLQAGAQQGVTFRVRKGLLSDAQATKQNNGWCGRLHGHLRLYCVIIRAAELQPTYEEIEFWLKTLGGEMDGHTSELGVHPNKLDGFVFERTLQLGISFFCLVPGLTGPSSRVLFHKSLYSLMRSCMSEGSKCNSETELAVWLSVQLLLRRFSDIAMIVREALGMHVTVHNSLMRELHDAAIAAELISDPSIVVKAAAELRPKGPISSLEKHRCFALECIEQLLSSGNFIRYGVDISDSVMYFISVAQKPIHPVVVQIIQAYAEVPSAIVQGKSGSQPFKMLPLSRSFLESSLMLVSCDNCLRRSNAANVKDIGIKTNTMGKAALTSFYILCRENFLRNTGLDVGHESSDSLIFGLEESEAGWWSELVVQLPFQELLVYMEQHWHAFEHLLPQWLSLAAVLFPERLCVPVLLRDTIEKNNRVETVIDDVPRTDDLEWVGPLKLERHELFLEDLRCGYPFMSGLGSEKQAGRTDVFSVDLASKLFRKALQEPLPVLRILHFLHTTSGSYGIEHEGQLLGLRILVVKELLPLLLDASCARSLQENFCLWWSSLSPALRESLLPEFLESVLSTPMDVRKSNDGMGVMSKQIQDLVLHIEYQNKRRIYNELVQEPLILLACKIEVFRTPLLSIFLDLLTEVLTVNRRVCLGVTLDGGKEGVLKREEITAALTAQDSAVCQILLEACLPNASIGDDVRPGPLLEGRRMICGFLSSFLHMNQLLLKLIHFQGYDARLIPMMVEGVPVMSQCLDFVQELLQQQQQGKQVFAIILSANIACAHPELPQSLPTVQQAVSHVSFIQNKVPGSSEFLCEVLGAMAQCACTFPGVVQQVVTLLQSCVLAAGPFMRSGPPRDPALQAAAITAFKQLIQRKVLYGRPPPLPSTFVSSVGVT